MLTYYCKYNGYNVRAVLIVFQHTADHMLGCMPHRRRSPKKMHNMPHECSGRIKFICWLYYLRQSIRTEVNMQTKTNKKAVGVVVTAFIAVATVVIAALVSSSAAAQQAGPWTCYDTFARGCSQSASCTTYVYSIYQFSVYCTDQGGMCLTYQCSQQP